MTKRQYANYSKENIIKAVKTSTSIAEVLRKLNLKCAGGNYMTIKLKITEYSLDCSHFKGQGWNKGLFVKSLSSKRNTTRIKAHLISIRQHKCESCNLDKWLGKDIPLELEHIDGNSLNHNVQNLKLLCPNCHALTPTYRKQKSSIK